MLAFVNNEFELNELQEDKQTLRHHLGCVYRNTGIMPDKLVPVECPGELEYLWGDFMELHGSRSMNGFGVNAISYQDIDCWNRLMKKDISPSEIEVIKLIDNSFLEIEAKKMQRDKH